MMEFYFFRDLTLRAFRRERRKRRRRRKSGSEPAACGEPRSRQLRGRARPWGQRSGGSLEVRLGPREREQGCDVILCDSRHYYSDIYGLFLP